MFFVIFIVLVLAVIALHELNHGRLMVRYGIKVPEAGLGIPVKFLPCLSLKISPRFTFKLHPLLLGAYVQPADEKEIERLSYQEKAHIFGAGIVANLVISFLLNAFLMVALLIIRPERWDMGDTIYLAAYVILAVIFLRFDKFLSKYVFPFLGLLLTGYLIWSIIHLGFQKSLMGPIGIVQAGLSITSLIEATAWAAVVSLGLGLINLLPLYPLDGGRILKAFLEKKSNLSLGIRNAILGGGSVLLVLLIVAVVFSDLFRSFS